MRANNCEKCVHMVLKTTHDGARYSECAKLDFLSSDECAKAEYGKGCRFYKEAKE